jgi:excisionase family DNA binding protein
MGKALTKQRDSGPVSKAVSTGVERHLRMGEAAKVLGVSRATLYRWLPRIRHRRICAGGLTREIILIPESALKEFLAVYEHVPGTAEPFGVSRFETNAVGR